MYGRQYEAYDPNVHSENPAIPVLARAIGVALTVALIGRSPGVDLLRVVDPHPNADDHVQSMEATSQSWAIELAFSSQA